MSPGGAAVGGQRRNGRCAVSALDQISYRARGASGGIEHRPDRDVLPGPAGQADGGSSGWTPGCGRCLPGQRLPRLRVTEAAFIRWQASARSRLDWELRRSCCVGQSAALTGSYALELPELGRGRDRPRRQRSLTGRGVGPRQATIDARARSSDAIATLVPLLAHALVGERRVTMPWAAAGLPDAVMWGLISILRMIGDHRPVSFLTYATGRSGTVTPRAARVVSHGRHRAAAARPGVRGLARRPRAQVRGRPG